MTNSVPIKNIVMSRFRLRGETVKEWAKEKGYKPDTVYKTIYGTRGKGDRGESLRIRKDLLQDGYWPKDETAVDAANG